MDSNNPNGHDSHTAGNLYITTVDQTDNDNNNGSDDEMLSLSLSLPQPEQTPPLPAVEDVSPQSSAAVIPRSRARLAPRRRSGRNSNSAEEKSPTIAPPYEWATNRRATVHSLSYLRAKQITGIRGAVQCRRCERHYEIEFDLERKFREIAAYFAEHKHEMRHRAPSAWQSPTLLRCQYCGQDNSVKPLISPKKRSINWLFLFLSQMLGCCTLEQLKYFCKHTRNHRTGAKNRVLYLTYLNICKQLHPDGPYDL